MMVELMDGFVELATTWVFLLLLATWRVLPILVLTAAIGLAFRRKLSPSLHALLWTLVVARLLLPISIGSPFSLHGPIDRWLSLGLEEPFNPGAVTTNIRHPLLANSGSPEELGWSPSPSPVATAIAREYTLPDYLYVVVLAIIVSVTAGLLIRCVFSHIRFAFRLSACRLLDDPQLIDLMLRECDALGVGRRPTLREVPSLAAPAVFGLMRQTICLPPHLIATSSEQEIRWILRHELAHIRRRDIPVMVTASIAGACHWFNPLAWVAVGRLRSAMEAAADRIALQNPSLDEAAAYGKLLLRIAESGSPTNKSPTLGLISFASGKHFKRRVDELMRCNGSSGRLSRLFSAALVAAIAAIGLTDGNGVASEKTPTVSLISGESFSPQNHPQLIDPFLSRESDGPAFVERYDVDSILKSMPASLADSNQDPMARLKAWIPLSTSLSEKLQLDGQTLVADLTARQHQLLKQMLECWKNGEPKQITIEARILQTDVGVASSIDWTGQRVEALDVQGLGPAIAARIGEHELATLIGAVSAERMGSIMFAPKVTLFDGQTASIADQVQRPFVTGVDSKADGVLRPVVSLVDEGLKFVFTPKVNGDGSITLTFEARVSNIGKVSYANLPIRSSEQAKSPITVQVPATEQYEFSASVGLAAGESVVVAIPRVFDLEPGADAETTMVVALTPRIIAPAVARLSTGLSR